MSESVCPKCSKPKVQGVHGSITQWMSSCACEIVVDSAGSQAISVTLCKTCGKRIEVGRSGSFTQWIFRSDKCECEVPEPTQVAVAPASLDTEDGEDGSVEFEMELDPSVFPTDRYKALREIGQGAAGQVFLCRDKLLNTKVAVKCLRFLTAEQLMSFQKEARATSKLSHPNIVKVLNFGATEGGAPYMVMEYIEGISLEKYLTERGPLSARDALHVITQVADALSYSHSKEIFHRDIKSSNIILISGESGPSVRIIDFGIAMLTQAQQEPTIVQGRTVVGTPAYMSPDQALGQKYDARSEVYSLGCIFFEALAGETPFSGDTALEVINKHAREAVPHIADKNPQSDCTPEIEAIIFTCLAKQKEDRYQSMAELRDACGAGGKTAVVPDEKLFEEEPERGIDHSQFEKKSSLDGKWMKVAAVLSVIAGVAIVGVAIQQVTTVAPAPMLTKHKISQNAGGILEEDGDIKASIRKSLANRETEYALSFFWSECDDDDLSLFDHTKIAENVNLRETNITDLGLKHFADSPIEVLNLEATKVRTLKYLPGRKSLRHLNLTNSKIDDTALANLINFRALRELRLNGTNVTANGIRLLKGTVLEIIDLEDCPNISKPELEKLRDEFPMWGINRYPRINDVQEEVKELHAARQYQKALDLWRKWFEFSKTHPDAQGRLAIVCLCGMGAAADSMKNFPLAQKYYDEALDRATKIGDWMNIFIVNDHLNAHYTTSGQREAAIETGLKAIDYHMKIYHEMPQRLGQIVGVALSAKHEYPHALQLLQGTNDGLEKFYASIQKRPQDSKGANLNELRHDLATTDIDIAECLRNLHRFDEAQQKLVAAWTYMSQLPDVARKPLEARYYLVKAKIEYMNKQFEDSLKSNQELMKLCRDKEARSEYILPQAKAQLTQSLKALGRDAEAEEIKQRNAKPPSPGAGK